MMAMRVLGAILGFYVLFDGICQCRCTGSLVQGCLSSMRQHASSVCLQHCLFFGTARAAMCRVCLLVSRIAHGTVFSTSMVGLGARIRAVLKATMLLIVDLENSWKAEPSSAFAWYVPECLLTRRSVPGTPGCAYVAKQAAGSVAR